MDFWYYFLHKAIDIISIRSIITFITPRYWLNSAGARKLILRIKENLSFVDLVDIGKLKVFADVAGYHMTATYCKTKDISTFTYHKLENNVKYINAEDDNVNKTTIILNNNNIYSQNSEIILSLESQKEYPNAQSLGTLYEVSQGVVESIDKISKKQKNMTLRNDILVGQGVFVLSDNEIENLHLSNKEKVCIKKYADSNIFKKYYINNKNLKNLIYSDKNIKNEICKNPEYCNLKRHLDNFQEFITSSNAPYGLHRPRDIKFFEIVNFSLR